MTTKNITQIILTYDYLFENRHKLYDECNKLVKGITFGRVTNHNMICPCNTEVLHAVTDNDFNPFDFDDNVKLINWDFPHSVQSSIKNIDTRDIFNEWWSIK